MRLAGARGGFSREVAGGGGKWRDGFGVLVFRPGLIVWLRGVVWLRLIVWLQIVV
jgi:hypothetical protein